jgi:hypothetical protein
MMYRSVKVKVQIVTFELDRVPIPPEKATKNTLEISHRVAPKLATIDICRHMYFAPVERLVAEGFIDRLYK